MVILGFMLNYMLRVNLTIAIVSMVTSSNSSLSSHSNESASVDECGARAAVMNDVTPIDDTRTPAIDVDVNRVNEANGTALLPSFPQRHRVRCDLCGKAELIRLTTSTGLPRP